MVRLSCTLRRIPGTIHALQLTTLLHLSISNGILPDGRHQQERRLSL